MADIRELRTFISYKKQSAIGTACVAADGWSLRQTNQTMGGAKPVTESDREDIGRGTPFPTQVFKISRSYEFPWEARASSENLAMLGVFGVGLNAKTTAGDGFKYSCKPSVLLTASPDMPLATVAQAIRQGGSDVFDEAGVGVACSTFGFTLDSTPGRDNFVMRSQWVGTGKIVSPSTISIPSIYAEHSLSAGGASAVTFLGTNYISTKNMVRIEFDYDNRLRLDKGYFPGSGFQDGFQIRGRMWRGDPQIRCRMTVLFENGSPELDAFLAQTEGTARITVGGAVIGAGPTTHLFDLQLHRVTYSNHDKTNEDGLVAATVDVECLEHSSNGVLTWDAICEQDNIGTAAS